MVLLIWCFWFEWCLGFVDVICGFDRLVEFAWLGFVGFAA